MPLEIRELHIKATVAEQGGQSSSSSSSESSAGGQDKEAIVSECIERVLQILKDKQER